MIKTSSSSSLPAPLSLLSNSFLLLPLCLLFCYSGHLLNSDSLITNMQHFRLPVRQPLIIIIITTAIIITAVTDRGARSFAEASLLHSATEGYKSHYYYYYDPIPRLFYRRSYCLFLFVLF